MHILFDIGKTKTRMAGSRDLATFDEPRIFETPKDYGEFIQVFSNTARKLADSEKIELVGGGIGGALDKTHSFLPTYLNFKEWALRPIREDLERELRVPFRFENDSAVVALGEAVYGAGRENGIVAYITISTGVGGARIVGKKVDEYVLGFEPGRQILSLESGKTAGHYLSGVAVEEETGSKPYDIHDPVFWDQKAKILAHFLNNVIVMWSPDVVILGGSMMNEIGIPIPATEKYLKEICKIFPTLPPLKHSELGDLGGLWGAMELLKQGA